MDSNDKSVIELGKAETDPYEEAVYKAQIEAARKGGVDALKGNVPVGGIPRPSIPYLGGTRRTEDSPLTPDGGIKPRPPGSPAIRQETLEQVAAFASASKKELDDIKQKKEEEKKKDDTAENLFDMLDMDARTESEKILNNKKRRKDIESRCSEMNIEDLIWKDEVRQHVPVVPNKFEIEFRSLTSQENLFIKKFIAKETVTADMYLLEKMGICQLTCALVSINGKALPDHRKTDGQIDEELFKEKFKKVVKMSGYIVTDLGINYMWFDLRVRRLINPELLGNG